MAPNTRGDYWVLDLVGESLRKIGSGCDPSSLMFAKFSPDGKRVAYVREHNIYVETLATGETVQLTRDGTSSSSTAPSTGSTKKNWTSAMDSAGALTKADCLLATGQRGRRRISYDQQYR